MMSFIKNVIAALTEPSEDEKFRDSVTEDEFKRCGLWGEYLHARQSDNIDEFWRRFGGMIRSEVSAFRSAA